MLDLKGVTFFWPGWPETYRFDLTVAPAEIVAVTGPSGAGKSTLLDLVAGFLTPSEGTIRLGDTDLVPLPPEDRPVSILFQADNVFEHLTAARNVELGLPRRMPRAERSGAIEQALREVGLEGLGGRKAANLSGGQRQRVALARTLVRARPVLLLDEPFSALDADTAGTMRELVGQLTRTHDWHVVLVTHQPEDVAALADRRYELGSGTLTPA